MTLRIKVEFDCAKSEEYMRLMTEYRYVIDMLKFTEGHRVGGKNFHTRKASEDVQAIYLNWKLSMGKKIRKYVSENMNLAQLLLERN